VTGPLRDKQIRSVNSRGRRIGRAMVGMILAAEDRVEAAPDDDSREVYAALRDRLGVLRTRTVERWSRP
jgi:hypothetical protein